jgi:hypothetical protein
MTLYVSKLKKYSFYRLLKSNNVDYCTSTNLLSPKCLVLNKLMV